MARKVRDDLGPYRRVYVSMHMDARVRALSPEPPSGRGLWWHLLAGEFTGLIPGVLHVSEAGLADSLNWPLEGLREAMREVKALGLAVHFPEDRIIWLPNALKYNAPASVNVVKSWARQWRLLPESDGLLYVWNDLHKGISGMSEGFRKAFRMACPKPNPLPSRIQEAVISDQKTGISLSARAREQQGEIDSPDWSTPSSADIRNPVDSPSIPLDQFVTACMQRPPTRQRQAADELFDGPYQQACKKAGKPHPKKSERALRPFVTLVVWCERHCSDEPKAAERVLGHLLKPDNRKWGDGSDVLTSPGRLLAENRISDGEANSRGMTFAGAERTGAWRDFDDGNGGKVWANKYKDGTWRSDCGRVWKGTKVGASDWEFEEVAA